MTSPQWWMSVSWSVLWCNPPIWRETCVADNCWVVDRLLVTQLRTTSSVVSGQQVETFRHCGFVVVMMAISPPWCCAVNNLQQWIHCIWLRLDSLMSLRWKMPRKSPVHIRDHEENNSLQWTTPAKYIHAWKLVISLCQTKLISMLWIQVKVNRECYHVHWLLLVVREVPGQFFTCNLLIYCTMQVRNW